MAVTDRVREVLEKLPPPYQADVLQYAEHLWHTWQSSADTEDGRWQRFAVASALRDMDDEDEVVYGPDDLEEHYS